VLFLILQKRRKNTRILLKALLVHWTLFMCIVLILGFVALGQVIVAVEV